MREVREREQKRSEVSRENGLDSPQSEALEAREQKWLIQSAGQARAAPTFVIALFLARLRVGRRQDMGSYKLGKSINEHGADTTGEVDGLKVLALSPPLAILLLNIMQFHQGATTRRASAAA